MLTSLPYHQPQEHTSWARPLLLVASVLFGATLVVSGETILGALCLGFAITLYLNAFLYSNYTLPSVTVIGLCALIIAVTLFPLHTLMFYLGLWLGNLACTVLERILYMDVD